MSIDLKPDRAKAWLAAVFGPESLHDVEERGLRFLEEAMELVQALGVSKEQASGLVEQVFDKPEGEPVQELGGVTVTLSSLCAVAGLDPASAFEIEFSRCETPHIIEKIRAKHATKAVVSSRFR
jgi:hypothetical protein